MKRETGLKGEKLEKEKKKRIENFKKINMNFVRYCEKLCFKTNQNIQREKISNILWSSKALTILITTTL